MIAHSHSALSQKYPWLPGFVLGLGLFVGEFGIKVLDPTYIDWLMRSDPATYFLGWHFFRHEPWQLPLGLLWSYGMGFSSSIIYTDSIPFLAFLFKPMSAMLPSHFQYFGLWLALCCGLQGAFACLLLKQITDSRVLQILGALFFILSPVMLWRMLGHFALVGHWLILAAFYLYFKRWQQNTCVEWLLLATVASLIHFYLLVMVFGIFIADLANRLYHKSVSPRKLLVLFVIVTVSVFVVMWLAGYFVIENKGLAEKGYSSYSFNLLSPFDSNTVWSQILPDIPNASQEQYEGFAYLGLGMIVLALVALIHLLRSRFSAIQFSVFFLFAICSCFTVFAISNRITLGPWVLLEIPVPSRLNDIISILHGSGRLFWPMYYFIMLTSLWIIIKKHEKIPAIVLVFTALLIQCLDIAKFPPILKTISINSNADWQTPLKNPFWDKAAMQYNKIYILPESPFPKDYAVFAFYAADRGMATSAAFYARYSGKNYNTTINATRTAIQKGTPDRKTLYIVTDAKLYRTMRKSFNMLDGIGEIDGYKVIAPGWFEPMSCCATNILTLYPGLRMNLNLGVLDNDITKKMPLVLS